jgi:hypothetical protein
MFDIMSLMFMLLMGGAIICVVLFSMILGYIVYNIFSNDQLVMKDITKKKHPKIFD